MRSRTLPCAKITKCAPRVYVFMSWGCVDPAGDILLYIRRLGESEEFVYYAAVELSGDRITFELDSLLFDKGVGRYRGRLLVGSVEEAYLDIDYTDERKLVKVENANV